MAERIKTAEQYARALRAVADWYDAHPDAPLPGDVTLRIACEDTRDEVERVARLAAPCRKEINDNFFDLTKDIEGIELRFIFWRSTVCTRRVTGYVEVPEHTTAAYRREVVEWDCAPILGVEEAEVRNG